MFTEENIKTYRNFVYRAVCYNPRTATDILINHKCQLYSASKIRELLREFISDRKENISDCAKAQLLIAIAATLPSYARMSGGMLICAATHYMTVAEIEDELEYLEDCQKNLWIEPFLSAGIAIRDASPEEINKYIELEAEKMPVRLRSIYAEVTFID